MSQQSTVLNAIQMSVKSIAEKFKMTEKEIYDMWSASQNAPQSSSSSSSSSNISTMKKDELVSLAKSRGLSHTGTKEALISRLTIKVGETDPIPEKSAPVEQNPMSKNILSEMKKDELVSLAKSRGLSHTGTKEALISRLTGTEDEITTKEKSAPTKEKTKEKSKEKTKEKTTTPKVVTQIQKSAAVEIKPNKFKNYEHTDSGLVFDNINGKVIGKQQSDGTVSTLTDSDIEQCKKYNFSFVMPSNLNKKAPIQVDDDDGDDPDLEEEKDGEEEDDVDVDVDDFIEEEVGGESEGFDDE